MDSGYARFMGCTMKRWIATLKKLPQSAASTVENTHPSGGASSIESGLSSRINSP